MPGTTQSTGWLRRNNGQSFTINTGGRHVISARVRFRGVDGPIMSASHSGSSINYGLGTYSNLSATPGSPPAHTTVLSRGGSWTYLGRGGTTGTVRLRIDGVEVFYGTIGHGSQLNRSRIVDGTSGSVSFYLYSSTRFDASYAAYLRVRYRSLNPTVTTAHGSAAFSGSRANNSTTDWINFSSGIISNSSIPVTVNVSGSNTVDVEVEYTYAVQPAVTTNDPSAVGPSTAVLQGNLTSIGHATTTRGFRYRKPGADWTVISLGTGGVGGFNLSLSGLDVTQAYEYQAYAFNVSQATFGIVYGATKTFETVAVVPEVSTQPASNIEYLSARLHGHLSFDGGVTTVVGFQWGESVTDNEQTIGELSSGAFQLDVNLDFDTTYQFRAFGENDVGRTYGATRTFTTPYPYLPAPDQREPEQGFRTQNDKPVLAFRLKEHPINPATKYHARLFVSQYVGMSPTIQEYESKNNQSAWQAYIGEVWVAFPPEGVDPDTLVRLTPQQGFPFGPVYWQAASWDGERYGNNSSPRTVRILLNVEGAYTLVINDVEWEVYHDLKVIEASNGELGSIVFAISNLNGEADTINYGDSVVLALRDWRDNIEEFVGRVRQKQPDGDMVTITAPLGDGFLSERRVKTNYPKEDVAKAITGFSDAGGGMVEVTSPEHGLNNGDKVLIETENRTYSGVYDVSSAADDTYEIEEEYTETDTGSGKLVEDIGLYVQDMVAGYCPPITTANFVNTETGFRAPIQSKDKTAISVMEQIRRNYGMYYFVDRDFELHFYEPGEVTEPEATVRLRRGDPSA